MFLVPRFFSLALPLGAMGVTVPTSGFALRIGSDPVCETALDGILVRTYLAARFRNPQQTGSDLRRELVDSCNWNLRDGASGLASDHLVKSGLHQ